MPSSYTEPVQTGKITELRDFALLCAHACDALSRFRDQPLSSAVPITVEPDTAYHDAELTKAEAELTRLWELSAEECEECARAAYEEQIAYLERFRERMIQYRSRYTAMLEKVRDWKVPPELEELRCFMMRQLTDSISWDCNMEYLQPPTRMTGEEWRESEIAEMQSVIEYHRKERDDEIRWANEANRWLALLHNSLLNI